MDYIFCSLSNIAYAIYQYIWKSISYLNVYAFLLEVKEMIGYT